MRLWIVTVLVAAAALAALPATATALSRKKADAAALKILKPESVASTTGVVVYGLPKPLKAGQDVFELGLKATRVRVKPLKRKAWLYWMDPAWGERFTHPTTLLLLDN